MHFRLFSTFLDLSQLFSTCGCFMKDMEVRKGAKQMEVLWRGAQSFGDSADVFTANFPTGFSLNSSLIPRALQPVTSML